VGLSAHERLAVFNPRLTLVRHASTCAFRGHQGFFSKQIEFAAMRRPYGRPDDAPFCRRRCNSLIAKLSDTLKWRPAARYE